MTATSVDNWVWVTAFGWHVTEIDLWNSNQNLSDTLNSFIWTLTSLTYLGLYNSNLTWPIPALNNLTSLTELNLEDNELTGTILDLTSTVLTYLSLGNNNLS